MDRRLSTIMATDVAGYSARMGTDEVGTIASISSLSTLVDTKVGSYGGRVFNRAGDGFMSEFSSPVSAVRAAWDLKCELASPEARREIGLELRIGIHLADVVDVDDDLLGDGVNIASRIETVAEPGSVLISGTVFEQVKRLAQLRFDYQGSRQLKNISDPVTVYSVLGELGTHSCATGVFADDPSRQARAAQT